MMIPTTRTRIPTILARRLLATPPQTRPASNNHGGTSQDNPVSVNNPNPKAPVPNTSGTPVPTSSTGSGDRTLQESPEAAEKKRVMQAPNRSTVWSRSQNPRERAMTGPRFEQTVMEDQPRPYAAIDLIHRQAVRWTHDRQVSCDGGGGPLGHPRIFINVDKPQVCFCTYCGVPFANEGNRAFLEAQPSTPYPLEPTGDPAQVSPEQRVTDEALGQR